MTLKVIEKGYLKSDKNGGPTRLAKILSESLITCNGFDKDDLVKRYLDWWDNGAFDTGPTFAMVFEKISNGVSTKDASFEVDKYLKGATAGCGPVHRIAPLASFKIIPTNQIIEIAREEAKITHYHPDAGNCSAIMALLCRYIIEGHSWDDCKKLIINNDQISTTWNSIKNSNLHNGGYVLDVMHSALYFLEQEDSLKKSLIFAGPANYCPIIVGIIIELLRAKKNK